MPELIKIEVTPDIAIKIRLMADAGLFAIKSGNATCNFTNGILKTIKTELYTYAKEEPLDFIESTLILE